MVMPVLKTIKVTKKRVVKGTPYIKQLTFFESTPEDKNAN